MLRLWYREDVGKQQMKQYLDKIGCIKKSKNLLGYI